MTHTATCRCGQFRVSANGEPIRRSVCHCLNCQKRSGSAFAAQVRFPADGVTFEGQHSSFTTTGDSGSPATFLFCPTCGSTVAFINVAVPGTVAIPLGVFDDSYAFAPTVSVFEIRKHPWLDIVGDDIEHD